MIRYQIKLTEAEVAELSAIVSKGAHSTHTFRNAYILLNCDEGAYGQKVGNEQLAKMLRVNARTIERVRKRFCEEGWEAVLERKPSRRTYERKVDGEVEAHLVQLCCSEPPIGRARWSLRLLADKMVALKYVDSLSYVTVREVLKKMNLSPGRQKNGSFRQNKIAPL
jgi:transposase